MHTDKYTYVNGIFLHTDKYTYVNGIFLHTDKYTYVNGILEKLTHFWHSTVTTSLVLNHRAQIDNQWYYFLYTTLIFVDLAPYLLYVAKVSLELFRPYS